MAHMLDGEYTVHGTVLSVEVSPCCWMYANYPLQVTYQSADERSVGACRSKRLSQADASREDVQGMLERGLTLGACVACGKPHLVNPDSNRGENCNTCFTARITAEYDQAAAKERDKQAKRDAKMKAKGFTHKVIAWVHGGGDDKQVEMYTQGAPSAADIKTRLRKLGSRILNDYTVTPLG